MYVAVIPNRNSPPAILIRESFRRDGKVTACSTAASPMRWTSVGCNAHLEEPTTELREQWLAFNSELRLGKLKHLDYDSESQTLIWRRPKADDNFAREAAFYEQLSFCDVSDVFRLYTNNAVFCWC